MKTFIRVSKYNGMGPATPIHVNADLIKAVERSPGGGPPTSTLWGIDMEGGQPLRVAEPVDQVVQMILEALK